MGKDLFAMGMKYDKWQDAVEAAISTNRLSVIGEPRGGQLVQYSDPSGAQINILTVEPFATFAGFEAQAQSFAHVSMINDVLALCEIVDYNGQLVTTLTCNLSQGPLIAEHPEQRWQQVGITALLDNEGLRLFSSVDEYKAETDQEVGSVVSEGAQAITTSSGMVTPTAAADISVRVLEAEYRHNELTGQRFIHATVDGSFALDVCIPDTIELPEKNSVLTGKATMVGSIIAPQGCGDGSGGCGSGGCGCGGH